VTDAVRRLVRKLGVNVPALRSLLAKAGWTAAQVVVAGISVDQLGLPLWAIAPFATALSTVKSYVAAHVGNPDTTKFFDGQTPPARKER
jgi:purine-cytosine permease-like protein